MKLWNCILPPLALGLVGLLLAPPRADGFGLLGTELGLGQRDFRIFNNFNDLEANDNQIPDPNFPGYQGAVMAIWKACVEWQSELHGDGLGDPYLGNLLGSGGANFDPSFQGLATEVGGTNDNIHSPLFGFGGAVFAFAEGPANDGWRIRYFEDHQWKDGPGNEGGTDLQGIATHEYGHVIGLAHTTNPGSLGLTPTMLPATATGEEGRSIELDDIGGIQAIYGPASPGKPRITGITVDSAQSIVTVDGLNFSSTGNTAWFTQYTAGGDGEPIKVSGLSSPGGTQLVVALPSTAGPGDLLIQNDGGGNDALSNAWPIDPLGPGPIGGNGEPVVSSVNPKQVTAVTLDGFQEIDVLGTNLIDTTNVFVGGIELFVPEYKVLHDGEIRIKEWPLVPTLGSVPVDIVTLAGQVTFFVQVISNDPPLIDLAGDLNEGGGLNTVDEMDLTLAGQAGDIVFLTISGSLVPSSLPGVAEFDIGNNFTQLYGLGSYVIPSSGWLVIEIGADETLAGVTVHLQGAVLDVDLPGFLPFTMTNVQSGTFVF